MNLSQLSKGFNILVYIGYTSTDTMAADLATKFYRGLVATVNSHLWRNGSVDGVIPLLDDDSTFLLTHEGKVIWTGKTEKCNHLACPTFDDTYCTCFSCNSSFWASYTPLFCGDMLNVLDLDCDLVPVTDPPLSDSNLDPAVHSVTPESDSNLDPAVNSVTPESDSDLDPTVSTSFIASGSNNVTSELSIAAKPDISGADIAVASDISDATNDITSDVCDANIDPVLSGSLSYSSIFRAGLKSTSLDIPAEYEKDSLVTQPLNVHQGNSQSAFPIPPASFYFDFYDVSGLNMSDDRWPRVFNELSDRAFVATTRPDGL